jgi:arylsulfatase A-like enzyme
MKYLAALLLLLGAQDPPRPNIIFIQADDLGYGDLSCYGQRKFQTPNADRMAAEGMKFTQWYAGSTVCAPSRCVLMTGLHTGRCFIRGNAKANLRPEEVTVAKLLKAAGYTTGIVGKWGLGHEGSSGVPTKQGFDYFYGYLDQTHAHNYWPTFLLRNEERVKLKNVVPNEGREGQGVASERVEYSPDLIHREALDFIDRNRDKRFFLYLASTLPHANNEAKNKGMEISDYGEFKDKDWPDPEKGRAAMIALLDKQLGEVLARLKKHGIDEKTLVLFTSDNGPHKEGGSDPAFFNSSGLLRGIKRDLTEGGIRVPMIARWPGRIAAGTVNDIAAGHVDFLPTAAEVAGSEMPDAFNGMGILQSLIGGAQMARSRPLYWEFYERGFDQAIRSGDWKAIRIGPGEPLQLYNLKTDPGEADNVAGKHPDIVARLEEEMKAEHVDSPDWVPKKVKK